MAQRQPNAAVCASLHLRRLVAWATDHR